MRINSKIFGIIALTAVIIFGMVSCIIIADNDDDTKTYGPTHFGSTLSFSKEEVWVHNRNTTKVSEVYYRFSDRTEIGVNAVVHIYEPPYTEVLNNLGTIKNGILNLEVPSLASDKLLEWDALVYDFFHEWYIPLNNNPIPDPLPIEIDTPGVRGNVITFMTTPNKVLHPEGFLGTPSSLCMQSIRFIYVTKDCIITLRPTMGAWPGSYSYQITNTVALNLKEGWNALLRTETYNQAGTFAIISLEVKNPNYLRWVMRNP